MSDTMTAPAKGAFENYDYYLPQVIHQQALFLDVDDKLHALRLRNYAAGIAADIRSNGHYRGSGAVKMYKASSNPEGPCCILASPTNHLVSSIDEATARSLQRRLQDAIGVDDIMRWSDTTPTHELLADLDKVAKGEDPKVNEFGETVQQEAARIADNLRTWGHYQKKPGQSMFYRDVYGVSDGQACLAIGPTPNGKSAGRPSKRLQAALGIEQGRFAVYSDETPTRVLLDQLDAIAES